MGAFWGANVVRGSQHVSSPLPIHTCSPVGVDGPEVATQSGEAEVRGALSLAVQPGAPPPHPAVTVCGRMAGRCPPGVPVS